ncbi:MAG: ribosome assembly RNA-binding protein YhbY [Candidatus Viridilinea halotolerans]|uniref:Ribosome assembly RNA-binding protein YhbY n=1 Tax=Candidatus Viridilinea halotolerans TaxID=2491704 RepID=A0A426U5A8_9CHLR|nr:MAG: ribosome assembly RNA-binding protein YhbY [Candidatus Viridilinea halotolerans]
MSKAQRAHLRKLANPLKPTVMVGKQGLTEQLMAKIEQELTAHELIKVRLLEYKDQKDALAATMVAESGAALVGIIGHVITLYRPRPAEEG